MGFKRLEAQDIIRSSSTVTSTVWSTNLPYLNGFFRSNTQTEGNSGSYYHNVFQTEPNSGNADIQFSIAYGDKNGRGSADFDPNVSGVSPSKSIYGQYSSLFLDGQDSEFSFGDNKTSKHIYVISLERARYKEKLLPGSLILNLTKGTNNIILTDNSRDVETPLFFGSQRGYYIVQANQNAPIPGKASPSPQFPSGYTRNAGAYGIFFPDTSTIILNGTALDLPPNDGGLDLDTSLIPNSDGDNISKLFDAFKESSNNVVEEDETTSVFRLNSEETLTSNFVYIRVRNSEFNYTENPTFVKRESGELVYDYFINNPQVYPTTIGLYNDSNELLAVAKLSRPIQKDFTKEALLRIKLDY